MNRSGRVGACHLHRAGCRSPCVTNEGVVSSRDGHVDKPLDVAAKELNLVDRLRRAPVTQLWRSIGGQDDERDATQARFHDCWEKIRRGGAGGTEHGYGRCELPRHTKREKRRRSFVDQNPTPNVRMGCQRDRDRGRSRTGADHRVAHAAGDKLIDECGGEIEIGDSWIDSHAAPSAESMGRSFRQVSSYSAEGTDSGTMPLPANSEAMRPERSAERMSTANSPDPSRPVQPNGPAYQPRLIASSSRMIESARSVG